MNALPADRLQQALALRWPALAITFCDDPPAGVAKIDAAAPSGCSYWRLAAEGRVFYTEADDHYNCPVGAHTHGIDLPAERQEELEGLIGTMIELKYLRADEVATIPRRAKSFKFAVYAPWSRSPCQADVVLVRGNAKQLMLLSEAARAAGLGEGGELMGRPTCAMIPETLHRHGATSSLGCIGNRVYNELGDDELYAAFPADAMDEVLASLETILEANRQLEIFHRQRMASLTS